MKEQEQLFDPVAFFWRQFGVMEEGWAKAWELVLADAGYSKGMGNYMDLFLSNQQLHKQIVHDFWEKMNLPTKQDLANVANQVKLAEEKVNTMQYSFEQILQMQKQLLEQMYQLQEHPREQSQEQLQFPEEQRDEPGEKKGQKVSKKKAKSED